MKLKYHLANKLFSYSFSDVFPGYIRKKLLKDQKIRFIPTELNNLPQNNFPISQNYSKAYLHHLFKTKEILGYRLATQHNLAFYNNLIKDAIKTISNGTFEKWSKAFLKNYND